MQYRLNVKVLQSLRTSSLCERKVRRGGGGARQEERSRGEQPAVMMKYFSPQRIDQGRSSPLDKVLTSGEKHKKTDHQQNSTDTVLAGKSWSQAVSKRKKNFVDEVWLAPCSPSHHLITSHDLAAAASSGQHTGDHCQTWFPFLGLTRVFLIISRPE